MKNKLIAQNKKTLKKFNQIELIKSFIIPQLEKNYKNDFHHGLKHSEDLLESAKILEKNLKHKVDWKILSTAIILHDVFAHKEKKHGKLACDYFDVHFRRYFSNQEALKIKEAIIMHDDKSVQKMDNTCCIESKILYDIDNIDAFGTKGIYRYIVIYSLRGDDLNKIAENIKNRYESLNFEESKSISADKYQTISDFFENINQPTNKEIIKFIKNNKNLTPKKIALKGISYYRHQAGTKNFFELLLREYN